MASSEGGLGCGSLTIKYLVFIFNLVFFICGLVLILVGGIAQGFFRDYVQLFDDELITPAMGMIYLGVVIVIVSFFGCCGASMSNVAMLRIFAFLLSLLLICQVAAGISVGILKSDVGDVVMKGMDESIRKYTNGSLSMETWDNIQMEFHCCGTRNYTDWQMSDWSLGERVPDSCCKIMEEDCGRNVLSNPTLIDMVYQDGCADSLLSYIRQNLGAIIGVAAGIAVVQLVGIWMSCCLIQFIKEQYETL